MGITHPHVHQINVSDGGVPKLPVPEARITVQGVAGDCQRSVQYHGGGDRAVCLYSLEVIGTLRAEGHAGAPGPCGENLTLAGLERARLKPGARLRIGTAARLAAMSYTAPRKPTARRCVDGDFRRTSQKKHP